MMYTLKIADGDLAVRGDGEVTKVEGVERIEQDLACWLLEPQGSDPMYRKFGSTLWSMIGGTVGDDSRREVAAEATRVAGNYLQYQNYLFNQYQSLGTAAANAAWGRDDLVQALVSVDAEGVADTVRCEVRLRTTGGAEAAVDQTL